MRILMLVDAVYEDAVGGSRVVVRELARRLGERGHAVTLLAPLASLAAPRSVLRAPRGKAPLTFTRSPEPGARSAPKGRSAEPGAASEASEAPYRIVRFGHRGPVSLVRGAARAGRSLIAGEGVDLVHVHFAYPAIGFHLPPLPQVPIVRTYYGSWAAEAEVEAGRPAPDAGGVAAGDGQRASGTWPIAPAGRRRRSPCAGAGG